MADLKTLGLRLRPEGMGVVGLQEAPRLRLPRLRASYSQVLEDGLLVSPEVAVPASDGVDQRQGPRPDRPALGEAAVGVGGRERRPCGAWLGELTSATEDVRIVVELRRRSSGLTVRRWRWVVLDVDRLEAANLLYDASCGRVR